MTDEPVTFEDALEAKRRWLERLAALEAEVHRRDDALAPAFDAVDALRLQVEGEQRP